MAFNIKTPFEIATHGKKFTSALSTTNLKNKSKAFAMGMYQGIVGFNDGSAIQSLYGEQIKYCTTQFDAVTGTTGATLTDIVGLTGFTLVAGATYAYEAALGTVATANSGLKLGFKYTTATLTSLENQAIAGAAAAVVNSRMATATDEASLLASTSAILVVKLSGRIVVNAAGTLALRAAQNAAHADTTSVFVGSWLRLTRTA